MARHRATRPSIASAVSSTSATGTRTRTKLSYEQSKSGVTDVGSELMYLLVAYLKIVDALLALAENSLKRKGKPLNVSAIVKDAERRAREQGLELGIRARPRIKKAVEKLSEHGAITEAPRKGRAPAEYRLTPKAVKVYNDAKSHRRSDIGIAKETIDTLKGNVERPNKRRRSSVSVAAASPPRSVQQTTITKLKAELAAARSEIASLKKSNDDLLDQQLDDDDDDIFDSPARNANTSTGTEQSTRPLFAPAQGLSFLGNRPTRPTTPEPTENGSPEYDAPGEFDYSMDMGREMTPPSSSPPDAVQTAPQRSEMELKMERLEASMSELVLEKAQMAEELVALKNQVEHERQNATRLAQVQHEADLVRVELAQVTKDRDLALKDASLQHQHNAELETRCEELNLVKEQLGVIVSQLNADLEARIATESEAQTSLVNATQELEVTKHLLALSQDEARRATESFNMADARIGLLTSNLTARDSTIRELQDDRNLTAEQLQALRGDVLTLHDELAFAKNRATCAETAANESQLQISGLKAEKDALQGTIEGLQAHNDQLVNEKAELHAQVEALKASAERDLMKIADLDREIEGLNAQIDSLHGNLDAVQFDKDQLRARAEADSAAAGRFIAQRDVMIAERDVQLAKLGADVKSRVHELSECRKRIGQLEAALAESTKAIESLQSSQKATEAELATSINTIGELNRKIADLHVKGKANAKCIGELEADLAKHKDSIEEHQDMISKLELQLDRLRNIELESLRRRRARIAAEAKRLRDEEADLTRETIDVDQWDEGLTQSRAARSSLAPSRGIPSSP
ncbi:hypothetical protein FRC06_008268 [Ceratobasidium sp. 370]|nr:hypothetical protein FRC06_008268 [Ceratobasidium sp. 370]